MTPLHKRACGPCTVCCVSLKIRTPELRKKAGAPCPHLSANGCGIYDKRPVVCRQFLCGWRLFEALDDSWRPDLSGVLILHRSPSELRPAWRGAPYGVHLIVTDGEAAVRRPRFAEFVAQQVARNIPVFLSASSPTTLINDHLDTGQANDVPALREKLVQLYTLVHAARWERGLFRMIVPLYRLQLDAQTQKMSKKSNR